MSTRSMILMRYPDGKVTSAYCHWDGYPSHNGRILLDHYKTKRKVAKLLSEGDMSYLASHCDCPKGHSFENPNRDCVCYYGRDRGEKDTGPRTHDCLEDYEDWAADGWQAYEYMFNVNDKAWYYKETFEGSGWKPLTEKVCQDD